MKNAHIKCWWNWHQGVLSFYFAPWTPKNQRNIHKPLPKVSMSTNGGPLNPSKRGLNGHNTLLLLSSWAQKTLSSNPFGPMDPWLRTYELDYFWKGKICWKDLNCSAIWNTKICLLNLTIVRSLSAEYNWVCDKADYGANVLTARSAGVVISMLIFMQLSDK